MPAESRFLLTDHFIPSLPPSSLSRLELRREEWEPFAFWDPEKLYTRNLVATDGKTFTLLLLCWNPGKVCLLSFSLPFSYSLIMTF